MFSNVLAYLAGMERGVVARQRVIDEAQELIAKDETFYHGSADAEVDQAIVAEDGGRDGDDDEDADKGAEPAEETEAKRKADEEARVAKELAHKLRRNRYKRAVKVAELLS
jgi:hypothetical protein